MFTVDERNTRIQLGNEIIIYWLNSVLGHWPSG